MEIIKNALHNIYAMIYEIKLNVNKLLVENGNNILVYDNKNILVDNIKKLNIDIVNSVETLNNTMFNLYNSNNEMKEIILYNNEKYNELENKINENNNKIYNENIIKLENINKEIIKNKNILN